MSATLLANDLTTLISEAKRRNTELRTAAEKSLQELKALPTTSEQQLALDLSRRPAFIDPFLLACSTRNAKFASSGVSSLQRLVVSRGLPRDRLQDALEAFNACTDLSLDLQLKVLQALPSLLQNYANELKGDLLSSALQVCASLQGAKVPTVSGVAAATLQQLITSVFENVTTEDRRSSQIQPVTEVPGDDEPIPLRPAAFDAYRVFRDLVLAAEGRNTKFVEMETLPAEATLELVWTLVNAYPQLFDSHPELLMIVRSSLLPLIITGISEKLPFPVTVRLVRLMDTLLRVHFAKFTGELEVALGLVTHMLEPEAAPSWKRALMMEVLQRSFAEPTLIIDAYAKFDQVESGKPVVQDMMSAFVRLSTEKPSAIGLGQQSTLPTGPASQQGIEAEQTVLEAASGMAGIISSALGVVEVNISGISSQWSSPRTLLIDQLDKTEPLPIPDTYIYSLVLDCLNNLSDNLAKIVLPLTVPRDKPKGKISNGASEEHGPETDERPAMRMNRSQSFRTRAVPLNPLVMEGISAFARVQSVAALIDVCWPALLATSSTFFNAALDDRYYRALIKGFQRFAQVAGLLRLTTPRDALITLLGKSAVPPHVLSGIAGEAMRSPAAESPRVFSNPRSLLSVDSFVSQASSLSMDRDRRGSIEPSRPTLTVRNLLCLRALLNLAIALGPTLDTAFGVVVDTLKQADMVLSSTSPQQMARQGALSSQNGIDSPIVVQAFTAEVNAVEAAASRLLESTADYPNEAFVNVLNTFCRLLHGKSPDAASSPIPSQMSPPPTPLAKKRTFSGLPGLSTFAAMHARDYQFIIPKLGNLAELNIGRFVTNDARSSGWAILVEELTRLTVDDSNTKEARRAANDVLCNMSAETIAEVTDEDETDRAVVQRRAFAVLLRVMSGLFEKGDELTSADIDIQARIVEAAKDILEMSGEALVAGWNKCIAIVSCAFERREGALIVRDDEKTVIEWHHITQDFVTIQLGRAAFGAVQVICSDFLSLIPTEVMPSVIELVHRFITQSEDLNMALTSITMAWNVSDFLFAEAAIDELCDVIDVDGTDDELGNKLQSAASDTKAAQWLLLLLRLRSAISSGSEEIRKASFQIVCSVFRTHGKRLSPGAWDLVLRSIIMRIALDDIRLRAATSPQKETENRRESSSTGTMSKAIISGIWDLLASHLSLTERIGELPHLWQHIIEIFKSYLALKHHDCSAAVYAGVSKILSSVESESRLWEVAVYPTASLWSNHPPSATDSERPEISNQDAFSNYADAAAQIYRLTRDSVSIKQVQTITTNLYNCLRLSDGPSHGADSNQLSPLQSRIMALLKNIDMSVDGAPSHMVNLASRIALLSLDAPRTRDAKSQPTFLALASEALDWLQSLVESFAAGPSSLDHEALETALTSLGRLVDAKYAIRGESKGTALWLKATSVALTIARPILDRTNKGQQDGDGTIYKLRYARITQSVVAGNNSELRENEEKVQEDEIFDIESFKTLEPLLVPSLGNDTVPVGARTAFARALFHASIVHAPEDGEVPSAEQSPLDSLHKLRRGRLKHVPFSRRERMSYVCFSEMVKLVSEYDGSDERKRLAQAIAPLLVLRLAIPIRAYIVDQPLKGMRPIPLSELEELIYCFEEIKKLKCERELFAADSVGADIKGDRPDLQLLLPLLVKAVSTASTKWCGSEEVLKPLQGVLEAVNPLQ